MLLHHRAFLQAGSRGIPQGGPYPALSISLYKLLLPTGPPTHPHVVKTASIGTLGRTRTPMIVTVPNAPDVPETSKMLEDVDSVSMLPHAGILLHCSYDEDDDGKYFSYYLCGYSHITLPNPCEIFFCLGSGFIQCLSAGLVVTTFFVCSFSLSLSLFFSISIAF